MEAAATSKYIRVSPRKLQLLVRGIKHLRPREAIAHLEYIQKSGATPLRQVIASALANAKQQKAREDLAFKQIQVTPGGAFKRFRAVSRGMAHGYKKRMSHVKVVLTESQAIDKKKLPVNEEPKEMKENTKSEARNPKQISGRARSRFA